MIFILLMLAVIVFLVLAIVLVAAVAAGTWLGAVIGGIATVWLAAGFQGDEQAGGHVPAKPPLWKVALGTIAGGLLGGLVGLGLTLLWIVMEFSAR